MPTQSNAVEVTIRAKNEASTQLDRLYQDFQLSRRGANEFAQAIGNLNPVLSRSLFVINDFVGATRGLDSALRTSTIAVGVGVAAFTAYASALSGAIDKQLAFQTALRSWDAGQIRSQIAAATSELDRMDATLSKLGQNTGWLQSFRNLVGLVQQAPAALGELLGFTTPPEARRTEAAQRFGVVAPIQGQQQANEINAATISAIMARLSAQQGVAATGGQQYSYEALGRQIEAEAVRQRDLQLKALESAYNLARSQRAADVSIEDIRLPYEARRTAIQEQFRTGAMGRQLAARTLSGNLFERYYSALPEETLGFEQITDPTLSLTGRAAVGAGREGILQRDIQRQLEESTKGFEQELGGGAEATGVGPTLQETIKGIEAANKGRVETRDLTKETAEIQATYLGLTKEQQDIWAAQIIQLTLLRDLEAAGADERQKDLANARAAMAEMNLEFTKAARENPLAGLTQGFENAARGAGETMQDFARNTARTMTQTFDDLFFSVFTGRFKDLGKSIANNLLRSVSGALSDLITQPAIRALSSGLQGLRGGLVPTLVAGGTALVPAGSVSAYGGTPGIVAPTAGVAGGVSGGGIYDSIFQYAGAAGSALGQYFGFGAAGGAAALEASTIAGYGGEAAFAGIAGAEGAGVDVFATGAGQAAGVGIGAAAGYVGAGVGILASIYAAYQTRSPGMGAAVGAIGGLTGGASIGLLAGGGYGALIGAVVGLIAGAAVGAGAGGLGGKGGHRSIGAERRSAQAVSEAVTNFSATLNQVETGEDLVNILNHQWAPNGEFVIYATASDGSERDVLRGLPFSYRDLFDPEIVKTITVAAGVTGTARPSFELTQALRGRIQQIAQVEAGLLFATQAKGPGITRTTYEAFAAALQGDPTMGPRHFFFSTDAATNAGASPAQVGSVIRAFLQTNEALDIAPDLTEDRFLNL